MGSAGPALAHDHDDDDAQPGIHQVQDADRRREFTGYLLHRVSTEIPRRPQWLEIELWKLTDGTGRYLLHFTGRSVLYHREGSECNTGVPVMAHDLGPDSEPCRKCRPENFRRAGPGTVFEAEIDRHKVQVCDGRDNPAWPRDEFGNRVTELDPDTVTELDPDTGPDGIRTIITKTAEEKAWELSALEVIRHLKESWRRPAQVAGTLSAPAQRLVDTAAAMDPAISAGVSYVEQV